MQAPEVRDLVNQGEEVNTARATDRGSYRLVTYSALIPIPIKIVTIFFYPTYILLILIKHILHI